VLPGYKKKIVVLSVALWATEIGGHRLVGPGSACNNSVLPWVIYVVCTALFVWAYKLLLDSQLEKKWRYLFFFLGPIAAFMLPSGEASSAEL